MKKSAMDTIHPNILAATIALEDPGPTVGAHFHLLPGIFRMSFQLTPMVPTAIASARAITNHLTHCSELGRSTEALTVSGLGGLPTN